MPSALIIGGGPAGSVAGVLLARAGWSVSVVEQHRFPRDKVCGECLSALGADVLRRVGLFDEVLSRGAVQLDRTLLHAPSGRCVDARLPRPMWGISRTALDGVLLDAAAGAGARVVQPARCERLTPGARPSVRVRDLLTNGLDDLDADYVLVADGKSAMLNGNSPRPTGDLGIKTHFENVDGPRDAVELFALAGCYGGLAAIEGGRWNAAFSVPAARVRQHRGDLPALFAGLLEENRSLRHRLAHAHPIGPWLAAPLPRFAVRTPWPQNVIPLGNAAAAIEPIGGEGIGLAMRSAELAATLLCSHPTGGASRQRQDLVHQYRALWTSRAFTCRGAAVLASDTNLSALAASVLSRTPGPLRAGMRLMGK